MTIKLHSLIDKVAAPKTLYGAYRTLARRASAAGSDAVSWKRYRQLFPNRLQVLGLSLRDESYRPAPYKYMWQADCRGKERLFVIPTVEDRVVQRAIRACLEPFYEARVFTNRSYEYRPGRHPGMAVATCEELYRRGRQWVLVVDVEAFFPSVNREKLDQVLGRHLADGKVLRLIQRSLGTYPDGLPLGNGLSPFLSNVYLHDIDVQLEDHHIDHIRWCDTFVIFASIQEEIWQAHEIIQHLLQTYHLHLNNTKTQCRYAPAIRDLLPEAWVKI